MKIILQNSAKRYNYEWIFRNLSCEFNSGKSYAITGPNGSGKSTLIKLLSGQLSPSEGNISYYKNDEREDINNVFQFVSYSAPYIEIVDDFNLREFLQFHFSFKKIRNNYTLNHLITLTGLEKHQNKIIKSFSSGMKQRVKLISAILSETEILLLDEPTTNLDAEGVDWYLNLIKDNLNDRITIVGSNMDREYGFCDEVVDITRFKVNADK